MIIWVRLAPICSEFCIEYKYILKTWDSASADSQYNDIHKTMTGVIIIMKIIKQCPAEQIYYSIEINTKSYFDKNKQNKIIQKKS